MRVMYQSDYTSPIFFESEDGLATGDMGDCVSTMVLGNFQNGRYGKIYGQHGAGGIRSCNFMGVKAHGAVGDSMYTRFIIVRAGGSNIPYLMGTEFDSMVDEGKLAGIQLSQFEVYQSRNACVLPDGTVHEYKANEAGAQIHPKARFIMKYFKQVKWDLISA